MFSRLNPSLIFILFVFLQYLVDWSKAMLPQISKITAQYDEWVHKPVDRPLRLFGPWYLEMCSKTPWWLVPAFWIPVITNIIYGEFRDVMYNQDTIKVDTVKS